MSSSFQIGHNLKVDIEILVAPFFIRDTLPRLIVGEGEQRVHVVEDILEGDLDGDGAGLELSFQV